MAEISRKEAIDILKEHNVPKNIIEHSEKVKDIAVFLAEHLKAKGFEIDIGLVETGALLHDLDKVMTAENPEKHGKIAREILKQKELHDIAEVVYKHILGVLFDDEKKPKSWEEKLVHYADKRVNNKKIATLDERFEYLLNRYGKKSKEAEEIIKKSMPIIKEIEKEIFKYLHFSPEMLEKEMKEKLKEATDKTAVRKIKTENNQTETKAE